MNVHPGIYALHAGREQALRLCLDGHGLKAFCVQELLDSHPLDARIIRIVHGLLAKLFVWFCYSYQFIFIGKLFDGFNLAACMRMAYSDLTDLDLFARLSSPS
jgi:hypothetical protein